MWHIVEILQLTDLGLKVKEVNRFLEFNQSPSLKQYTDFNTQKRTQAENLFEKDFFRLMNNSVFGKTMENLRERVDVTDEKKANEIHIKTNFCDQ